MSKYALALVYFFLFLLGTGYTWVFWTMFRETSPANQPACLFTAAAWAVFTIWAYFASWFEPERQYPG